MKMIQTLFLAGCFLGLGSCSLNDDSAIAEELTIAQLEYKVEVEDPIFIQEIMLLSIENDIEMLGENPDENAEEIEMFKFYREYLMKEIGNVATLPGQGCHTPKPCNCKVMMHVGEGTLHSYGELEFELKILGVEGNEINEIVGSEPPKCPEPTKEVAFLEHNLAEPMDGEGTFVVEAYFEPAGEVMTFKAPYKQQ